MGSYLLSILIRYPNKSILGNKGFISAHSSLSVPAEKSQWQECDIAGHIAPEGQKQGRMNLCIHANAQPTHSFPFLPGPKPWGHLDHV